MFEILWKKAVAELVGRLQQFLCQSVQRLSIPIATGVLHNSHLPPSAKASLSRSKHDFDHVTHACSTFWLAWATLSEEELFWAVYM